MLLRMLGSLVLALAVLTAGLQAGGVKEKKDVVKDKAVVTDKGDKEAGKDPAKDPRAVKGKVLSVDLKGSAFTIEAAGEKEKSAERTFGVTKETQFLGPRGGKGEGLKDDRLAKGYDVIVIPTTDGKAAASVHLGYRKAEETKKVEKKAPTKEKK